MGRARKREPQIKQEIVEPTARQMEGGAFVLSDVVSKEANGVTIRLGKAYRRRPMIDVLLDQGLLSEAEYRALKHYRHHADIADRSPLKDSIAGLMRISGGRGTGPTVEMLNAIRVRDDCERAAGSLYGILRAVVVDDLSLSDWAMRRNGSVEKCRNRNGTRVCRVEATPKGLEIARLDIRMAAKRVKAELDA